MGKTPSHGVPWGTPTLPQGPMGNPHPSPGSQNDPHPSPGVGSHGEPPPFPRGWRSFFNNASNRRLVAM
eukprot:5041050-Prymnesium_polylepis.1